MEIALLSLVSYMHCSLNSKVSNHKSWKLIFLYVKHCAATHVNTPGNRISLMQIFIKQKADGSLHC